MPSAGVTAGSKAENTLCLPWALGQCDQGVHTVLSTRVLSLFLCLCLALSFFFLSIFQSCICLCWLHAQVGPSQDVHQPLWFILTNLGTPKFFRKRKNPRSISDWINWGHVPIPSQSLWLGGGERITDWSGLNHMFTLGVGCGLSPSGTTEIKSGEVWGEREGG